MRVHFVALLLMAVFAACRATAPASGTVAAQSEAGEIFRPVAGSGDWARGDSTCLGNTHTIAFGGQGREMVLTFREPIDSVSRQRVVRYKVLQAGSNVQPELPVVIRAAMEGETRRTESGVPVVWDLIMASPNRYHWHRTDWPNGGVTGAVIRCDGAKPLEQWQQPVGTLGG
jgi:hypothetical protein